MTSKERSRRLFLEALEDRRLLAFNPTGNEQEFLQLTNRFRADPKAELSRLVSSLNPIASNEPNIDLNVKFWKVNGAELNRQWQTLVAAPPLAWHESLYNAAAGHNQTMIANRDQQHQFPGEPNPGDRMKNAGYPIRAWAENIAAFCTTVLECHAAYAIDWGPGPTGIQTPPKHRINQLNPAYREVGIAVTPHAKANASDVGPLVNTQDFSNRLDIGDPYVVGAVFNDKNSSGWYENGEGLGGATIQFTGATGTFRTTSMSAGGYQIHLPAGTYTGTASGGGLKEPLHFANIVVTTDNVWTNFIQTPNALSGDRLEPNNTPETASALASGDVHLDRLSIHLPDNDDVYRWTSPSTGNVKIDVSFQHSAGNLDLFLLNDAKAQVASSRTAANRETISWPVTAGSVWYVVVKGANRAKNPDYVLDIDSPGGAAPQALADKTATDKNAAITINVLANDTDADGDIDRGSVQITTQPRNGTLTVNSQGVVSYTPRADFLGVDRFGYKVRDTAQMTSQEATATVAVVDYANSPWRNPANPLDIDASGVVVPVDALVIINRLNDRGPGPLSPRPTGIDSPPGFVDPSGDNFLSSIDALRVINFLNQAAPEGEFRDAAMDLPVPGILADVAFGLPGLGPTPSEAQAVIADSENGLPVYDEKVAADTINWLAVVPREPHPSDRRDDVFGKWDHAEDSLDDLLSQLAE